MIRVSVGDDQVTKREAGDRTGGWQSCGAPVPAAERTDHQYAVGCEDEAGIGLKPRLKPPTSAMLPKKK